MNPQTRPALAGLTKFALSLLAAGLAAAPASAQWKPSKNVEIVAPTAAGGAADRTARLLQKVFQEGGLVASSTVVNRAGASGGVALNYLSQQAADPHYLLIHNEPLVTNHITGLSQLMHADFTPVAMLTLEDLVYAVKADSPMRSGKDLLDRLRKDPSSVAMAVGSALGNNSHMAIGLVGKASGVDVKKLKIVIFNSGSEVLTALLGGHIELIVTTLGSAFPHIQAGRLRALATNSAQRLPGAAAAIPTWKEQGVDVVYASWRVAIAARGLSSEQVAYWEDVIGRATQGDEWKQDLERNFLRNAYAKSAETRRFLDGQNEQLRGVLTELGLAK